MVLTSEHALADADSPVRGPLGRRRDFAVPAPTVVPSPGGLCPIYAGATGGGGMALALGR